MKFFRPQPAQPITLDPMDIEQAKAYLGEARVFIQKAKTQSLWCLGLMLILPWPFVFTMTLDTVLCSSVMALGTCVFFGGFAIHSLRLSQHLYAEAADYSVLSVVDLQKLIPKQPAQQVKLRQLLLAQGARLLRGQADALQAQFVEEDALNEIDAFIKHAANV